MKKNTRTTTGLSRQHICSLVTFSLLALSGYAQAGAYIFAGDANGIDVITHPSGYTGTGGDLNVKVCIRPTSSNTANLEQPVRDAIATWNELKPTTSNLLNNVPGGDVDVESVILHEMGHCIGLAHVNLATESGLGDPDRNFTKTTRGSNGSFDLGSGADGVIGSTDDNRGDDVNLHWFRISNNNPFSIASIIDSTTYARGTNSLPVGHSSVANGDRDVSPLFGAPNTEAVMQQGQFFDEAQRTLTHDGVATIRLAESGLDTIANTADDYSLKLTYGGISNAADCDINVGFDNSQTGFAVCAASGIDIQNNHLSISGADIYLNDGFTWHFNTVSPCSKSFSPTANQWKMLSMPCQLGISTSAKLQDQFGDDLDVAQYGTTWVLWRYDPTVNNYVQVALTDDLEEGVGYWFITTSNGITVDVDGQYNTNIDVPLIGDSTNGKWNMIGSPFRLSTPWSTAKVVKPDGGLLDLASADPDVGGTNACVHSPIDPSCVMADTAFKFDGTNYVSLTPSGGNLDPFDAAWVFVGKQDHALRLAMTAAEVTTP